MGRSSSRIQRYSSKLPCTCQELGTCHMGLQRSLDGYFLEATLLLGREKYLDGQLSAPNPQYREENKLLWTI